MGKVLKLKAHRRNRLKWSTYKSNGYVTVQLEWRTADRAGCLQHHLREDEFAQLSNPAWHFWQLIDYMTDRAREHGGRV